MGTGEKKQRREIQRVLNRFVLRAGDTVYSVKDHPDAREMIIEFAEPVEGLFDTLTTRYSIAIFAWNLSLVPEERRLELINDFLTPLVGENEEGRQVITELMLALLERRLELYPKEEFLILPLEDDDEDSPNDREEEIVPWDEDE